VKLLEKEDQIIVKEILKTLCNISNTETGKKLLMQCNVATYINKLLKQQTGTDIIKSAVTCISNIATCDKLKRVLAENHSLLYISETFKQALTKEDNELLKYCLYFFSNVCEGYPEASYVLGQLSVIPLFARLLNGNWPEELITDALDSLHSLLTIETNM
jgi:hypothetical protein